MHRLLLCLFMCVFSLSDLVHAEQTLRFSGFDAPVLMADAEAVLAPAYAELGIRFEVVKSPGHRALLDAASGKTDGELVRFQHVETLYDSLVRVKVPIVMVRTFAYTNKPELLGKQFSELKHLRIGYVIAVRFTQKLAEGFAETWEAETPEQLFEMLQRDRVDLVMVSDVEGNRAISQMELSNVFPLASSQRDVPFFHFLHIKHADLVPQIETVLRRRGSGGDTGDRPDKDTNLLLPASPPLRLSEMN